MRTNRLEMTIRAAAGAMLLGAALLAGCAKPAPAPEAPPPALPPSAAPAVPDAMPPAPDASPAAPVQPAPDAPPPTEPSPAPKPTASNEPSLEFMRTATPTSAKISVAVDLRYSFDGAVVPNQPVMLHLAAVPRVAGTNLKVSVKQVDGVQLAAGSLNLEKSGVRSVYRQQISVTPLAAAPAQLRVLVTMDVGADSGFGFFSIPLDRGTNAQKQDSVKQR
jgi:hypothetical protein